MTSATTDPEIRLSVLLGELDRLAERYDGDHLAEHWPCDCRRPSYQVFVNHITSHLRGIFEPEPDELEIVLPEGLSKDQRHRLRKKYGLTRQYTRQR